MTGTMAVMDDATSAGAVGPEDLANLSGAQKAAIVLLKLGRDRSAKILRLLGEGDLARITAEIMQAEAVSREEADASVIEFATMAKANDHLAAGGIARARELLEASLGVEQATEILDNLRASMGHSPFDFLLRSETRQVVNVLGGEHPQTVALVLAHLTPEYASEVLSGLAPDMQREVSIRIAQLEQSSPEVIAQLERMLQRRLGANMNRATVDRTDGVQMLIDILNRSDRATERSIFEGLEEHAAELADHVRARMFVFEDIATLEDRAIQLILREIESRELAMALKGVRDDVKDKIKGNMSSRAAQNIDEEISLLGPVRMSDVEAAQGAVVAAIRALEETGQIVVSRGTDEFVE